MSFQLLLFTSLLLTPFCATRHHDGHGTARDEGEGQAVWDQAFVVVHEAQGAGFKVQGLLRCNYKSTYLFYQSVYLFVDLIVGYRPTYYLSVYLSLCIYLSFDLSLCLSTYLSICLSLFVSLSIYLSIRPSIHPSLHPSINLYMYIHTYHIRAYVHHTYMRTYIHACIRAKIQTCIHESDTNALIELKQILGTQKSTSA